MRAFVFTDKALGGQAGRFVWLSINTERSKNAALHKKFPVQALPSYFIVDPATEQVTLRWVGGATVPQLQRMLDQGVTAVAAAHAGGSRSGADTTKAPADAAEALAKADRLYGEGRNAEAAQVYGQALAMAPATWPFYGRAVESRLFALQSADDNEAAAKLALDAFPRLARTESAANVAASGLGSALSLPATHADRVRLVTALTQASRAVLADSTLPLAADDRSAVYGTLIDERKDAKDDSGAHQLALAWSAFLDEQAARATSLEQRATFDPHRLGAYLELGQPERAVPMLQASERDFPDDYNPPARLAVAYRAMKRWDEALAASDRAMARAYGPRKLGIYRTRADIFLGRGDPTGARRTLEEAIRFAQGLPPGQHSEGSIAALKKKLADIPPPAN